MNAKEARKISCNYIDKDLQKYNVIENILDRIEEIAYEGGDYYSSVHYLSGFRIIKTILEDCYGYKVTILKEEESFTKNRTIVYYKISW